jgi:Protein of unknown function (DUF4058)
MKSPFPGMDPYLERCWGDVHQGVITYIRDWLQSRLPSDLRARMQERVYIELPGEQPAFYYPDFRVIERPRSSLGATATGAERSTTEDAVVGEASFDEPLLIHLDIEPVNEGVRLARVAAEARRALPGSAGGEVTSDRRPVATGRRRCAD